MDVMEGKRLISFLENSDIKSWLWSVAHKILTVSSTVDEPNLPLPII